MAGNFLADDFQNFTSFSFPKLPNEKKQKIFKIGIKTFLAEMVPGVGKDIDYDIIGKPLTTTGRFG